MDDRRVINISGQSMIGMLVSLGLGIGVALMGMSAIKFSTTSMKGNIASSEKLRDNIVQFLALTKVIKNADSIVKSDLNAAKYGSSVFLPVNDPDLPVISIPYYFFKIKAREINSDQVSTSITTYKYYVTNRCIPDMTKRKPKDPKSCLIIRKEKSGAIAPIIRQVNHIVALDWCLPGQDFEVDCDMGEVNYPEPAIGTGHKPFSMNRVTLAMRYTTYGTAHKGKTMYAVIKMDNVTAEESFGYKDVTSVDN